MLKRSRIRNEITGLTTMPANILMIIALLAVVAAGMYAMRMKGRAQGFAFVLLFFALFPAFFTLHATNFWG